MLNVQNYYQKKGGLTLTTFIVLLITGALIFYTFHSYKAMNLFTVYDLKGTDQEFSLPPYSEKISDPNRDLFGECDIRITLLFNQICDHYQNLCKSKGFYFEQIKDKDRFIIEVRKGLVITGELVDQELTRTNGNKEKAKVLQLRWIPVLNASQAQKCKKLFGSIKTEEEKDE